MEKRCIFSGSDQNLNTEMTVTLSDGEKVTVFISDAYADDATPKMIREAAEKQRAEKTSEIEELRKKAAELGLTLAPLDQSPAQPIPQAPVPPQAPVVNTQPNPQVPTPPPTIDEGKMIDGTEADKKVNLSIDNSAGAQYGAAGGGEYDIRTEEKPSENLKEGEKAEIGYIKGRGGMQTAIPVRRVGKSGETTVKVVDTGGDRALQDRFKGMANDSENPNAHSFGKDGYQVRTITCTLCNGDGYTMNRKCPKCDGAGMLDA